jgi:hypothetical protein
LLSRDVEDQIPVQEFKDAIYHGTAE